MTLTKTQMAKYVRAVRTGMPPSRIPALIGSGLGDVSETVSQGEVDRAAGRDTEFSKFVTDIARAEADFELSQVETLSRASKGGRKTRETKTVSKPVLVDGVPVPGKVVEEFTEVVREASPDWRAGLVLLERRFPTEWAPKQRIEHLVNKIDYTKLSDDQIERISAGEDPIQVILSGYMSGNEE